MGNLRWQIKDEWGVAMALTIVAIMLYSLGVQTGIAIGREQGYYLWVYQYCLDREPDFYTLRILNDYAPALDNFEAMCRYISIKYESINDYSNPHPGWDTK